MLSKWIVSSTFLPHTGEPVDFLLVDREIPIHGTFADGSFHTRYADYEAGRVQSWRPFAADPAPTAIAEAVVPQRGVLAAGWKRLAGWLAFDRGPAAAMAMNSNTGQR